MSESPAWADGPALNVHLLTVPEVAGRLRVSTAKVWQLLQRGELRSLKIDASRRIPSDAIDEYIASLAEAEQARRAGSAA